MTIKKTSQLILIGCGHSHLIVLEHFAKHPLENVAITVVSRSLQIPYSGMIPGLIAGFYQRQQCHIDIAKICQRANAHLIQAEIDHIDTDNKTISGEGLTELHYDWLSINIGSQSHLDHIKGAQYQGLAAKPLEQFLERWSQLQHRITHHKGQYKLAIVGGGAASFELALAMQTQLQQHRGENQQQAQIIIISTARQLLPNYHRQASMLAQKIMRRRNIKIYLNSQVSDAHHYGVELQDGTTIAAHSVIWATQAGTPAWLKKTALQCDSKGFICVNSYLQSPTDSCIFAAGDVTRFTDIDLPKSGVYAIRAGQTLAKNLHSIASGKTLKAFRPQNKTLNILTTGDNNALAIWGGLIAQGKLIWFWKRWLDLRFMNRFRR